MQVWIDDKIKEEITLLSGGTGTLRRFIVERFIPHESNQEYYISFRTENDDDVISMSAAGGVDIMKKSDQVTVPDYH